MNKIKIGILGVSNHLLKRIALPLEKTNNCHLYAIASRTKDKACDFAKEFGLSKYYDSYEKLLDDKDIDAVYIPLPNHLHAQWIVKAAHAGKHILCEKPISLNASEASDCLNIVNKNKVLFMEAFMYQFHPQWIHAQNLIRTNQIGKIMSIHTSFNYNNADSSNIRNIKEFGGGALMDIGCYAISASRFLLQKEPKRVISLFNHHDEFKTDILSSAIIDFEGTNATFTVSTLSDPNQFVEIIGSSGTIKIHVPFNTYVDTKAKITVNTPQGSRDVVFDECDQYGLMFEAFSGAIYTGQHPSVDPTDSINNMKVIDALFLSDKTQKWELI